MITLPRVRARVTEHVVTLSEVPEALGPGTGRSARRAGSGWGLQSEVSVLMPAPFPPPEVAFWAGP